MSQHVTYRKFTQEEEAARFIELMQAEGIDYTIDDNHRNLDETLYGEQPLPLILVKVAPENFNRLNQLLQSRAEEELKMFPPTITSTASTKMSLRMYYLTANNGASLM